jgi:polyphosphate kinase 2 (PPK2 family)
MLEQIDLAQTLKRADYEAQLAAVQLQLVRQQPAFRQAGGRVLVAFEGWDASGKGGCIQQITTAMDPRGYQVWPISAPNDVERRYPYLWRFWTRLPIPGQVVIFDRSWYGRVLVERVEGLTPPAAWRRAYREIREFEQLLTEEGITVVKFWLHITPDEQLKRFQEREADPFKQWKIGPEDWRNRARWTDYVAAVEEMVAETQTPAAPWHLIAAESKHVARVATARIVNAAMAATLSCDQ